MKKLIAAALLFASANSFAQTLDSVTVTATLKPASVSGRDITVIKGDAFQNLPVHSLDDLLKYIPGIELQQRGPNGSQGDIIIRGATFQQTLVILDGVRLNDPNTGHFSAYIPIAPSQIDRIEVLKGAASAIYGSEAVGGVISIITKRKGENELSGSLAAGEYGLWLANIGGMYSRKNSGISFGALSNNADGQSQRGTDGFHHNNTVSLSAFHNFQNWKFFLRTSYDRRSFSAQNFYTTFKSDTAKEAVETFWNQASLVYQKGNSSIITDAGYKKVFDNYAFNTASAPNKNFSQLLQVSSRLEHSFLSTSTIISGVQYRHSSIRSNDRGNHDLDQFAVFVLYNQTIKHFFFSPAIRLDRSELVPQLNIAYKLKSLQLRTSLGKTIRQADFTESYNNFGKALVTSGSIGNPDLSAERSFSYEVGADLSLRNLKISSTIFRRNQDNVIDYVPTPYSDMPRKDNLLPTGTYALAKNIASVNTTGFETSMQLKLKTISGSLGLLWLDTKTSETTPSFYILSHAKFMVNGNITYTASRYSLSATYIFKHRANLPDYFLAGAKAELSVLKHKGGIFLEAQNLFNITYSDLLGAPMPGRWLSFGIKYDF